MPSKNKTTLGLNLWEGNEYFKREDLVKDNEIIDSNINELKENFKSKADLINGKVKAEQLPDMDYASTESVEEIKTDITGLKDGSFIVKKSKEAENIVTKIDTNCRYTANPKGGLYCNNCETIGAIKITLPCTWTSTMLKFKVSIFNYKKNNKSIDLLLSGYNYEGANWVNISAVITSNDFDCNYKIRFGHDGEKCCIYIGEVDSAWAYPMVHITDLEERHHLLTGDTWNISLVNEFQNVTNTLEDNLVVASDSQKLGGIDASNYVSSVQSNMFGKHIEPVGIRGGQVIDSTNWNAENKAPFNITTTNNQLSMWLNPEENARKGYIQVGHVHVGYAHCLGSLDINPYGGKVLINGNKALHSGNLNEFIKGGTAEPTSFVGEGCLYCVYE